MRVAMIGQKGIPANFGGVERHVEELSLALVARGHHVTVYTRPHYTPARRRAFHGVHLVSLPTVRTKHLDAISHTLFATLHAMRHDMDIMHYHGVGPALLSFVPRLLRSRAKVIVTFHSIDREQKKWGPIARMALHIGEWAAVTFPHQTIAVSHTLQNYCRHTYGKETLYVPNGVPSVPVQQKKTYAIGRRFGLLADQYILVVSRLIPHKGIHYLIKAYQQLRTDKRLVIVGDAYYTESYVRDLRKLAGNDPRIIFTGFQHGRMLAELLTNAYLFVLPTENEGLSIALLEAASFGKPILASNIPANLEIIRSGKQVIGYTFRNKDTADLTHKLRQLLARPQEIKATGRKARTVIRRTFNWPTIARSVEQAYATTTQ